MGQNPLDIQEQGGNDVQYRRLSSVSRSWGWQDRVYRESRNVAGKRQDFYIMRILENDMKIMIPVPNATTVGLRGLIDSGDIPKVFEILRTREISINGGTWNRRYRGYMEKIKTGSIYELAEVLRDLTVLKGDKELSFGERKMLDTARGLLLKELSIVREVSENELEEEIREILK